MWHLGIKFSGECGGDVLRVELDDLRGLFKPQLCYYSITYHAITEWVSLEGSTMVPI